MSSQKLRDRQVQLECVIILMNFAKGFNCDEFPRRNALKRAISAPSAISRCIGALSIGTLTLVVTKLSVCFEQRLAFSLAGFLPSPKS